MNNQDSNVTYCVKRKLCLSNMKLTRRRNRVIVQLPRGSCWRSNRIKGLARSFRLLYSRSRRVNRIHIVVKWARRRPLMIISLKNSLRLVLTPQARRLASICRVLKHSWIIVWWTALWFHSKERVPNRDDSCKRVCSVNGELFLNSYVHRSSEGK